MGRPRLKAMSREQKEPLTEETETKITEVEDIRQESVRPCKTKHRVCGSCGEDAGSLGSWMTQLTLGRMLKPKVSGPDFPLITPWLITKPYGIP